MIYSVVPKALADELYPKLVKHYEGDENVTVIVERREFDRRGTSAWQRTLRVPSSACSATVSVRDRPPICCVLASGD